MAFNFPNSPSLNDTHTENGITFKWDGVKWDREAAAGPQGRSGAASSATCRAYQRQESVTAGVQIVRARVGVSFPS